MSSNPNLNQAALSVLKEFVNANAVYVGYSGGMDSHVLLHTVSQSREQISKEIFAIHVNHGLNEKANQWAEHCQNVCDAIDIKLIQINLDATAPKGESQEEWARDLRYEAVENILDKNDLFLTAHHKDDLAETILLQLLRGAGPAGLSAMPEKTQLGEGWHVRPLLDFTREEMASYAADNNLNWINDDSNDDVRFDRNYLRQMVMPSLKQRWPGVLKTLSRAAGIQSNVNELIEDLAAQDLSLCIKPENNTLNAHHLGALSSARAVNVIRYWLKMHQYRSPGAKVLEQILSDIVNSQSDTSPCIRWGDVEIRRYRDMVFLTRGLPTVSDDAKLISWNISDECELEFGKLKADIITGQGIAYNKITGSRINIRYRTGHEQIKLGGHHHTLKNVFQEKGIPPCFRAIIPLIYIDNRLVEITGLCIDEDFTAGPDEKSLFISWDRADEIYAMQY